MSSQASVKIVTVDYYMSPPINGFDITYSEFRGSSVHHVPTVRIFGSTTAGQTICLHVHGVLPYMYIPYDGSEQVNTFIHQISAAIDKSVNISLGQASSAAQHIYKIALVSGIPIYGFHDKQHQFLKIYAYNPLILRKIGELFHNQVVLGNSYQPHEYHIPFIMQFMIDYNLHGMSCINLSKVHFRGVSDSHNNEGKVMLKKISHCQLEADVFAEHILNRLEISSGCLATNPGIATLWEDEKQRLRNKQQDSQIGTCLSADTRNVEPTNSHLVFKQALLERLSIMSDDLDASKSSTQVVYPAETPESSDLLDASFVDLESLDSTLISQDKTTKSVETNELDSDMKQLYDVLQNLGDVVIEEGSILSQTTFIDEDREDVEDPEENLDLSVAIDTILTQRELVYHNECDEDTDSANETIIPQVDGNHESDSEGNAFVTSKLKNRKKCHVKNKTIKSFNKLVSNDTIGLTAVDFELENIEIKKEDSASWNTLSSETNLFCKRDPLAVECKSEKNKVLIPVIERLNLHQIKNKILLNPLCSKISSSETTANKTKLVEKNCRKLKKSVYSTHTYNLRSRMKKCLENAVNPCTNAMILGSNSHSNEESYNMTPTIKQEKTDLKCVVSIPLLDMPQLNESQDMKGTFDLIVPCKTESNSKITETFAETLARIKKNKLLNNKTQVNNEIKVVCVQGDPLHNPPRNRRPVLSRFSRRKLSKEKAQVLNLLVQGFKPNFCLKPAVRPYIYNNKGTVSNTKELQIYGTSQSTSVTLGNTIQNDQNYYRNEQPIHCHNVTSKNLFENYTYVRENLIANSCLEKHKSIVDDFFKNVDSVYSGRAICLEKLLKKHTQPTVSRPVDLSQRYLDGTYDSSSDEETVDKGFTDFTDKCVSPAECQDQCSFTPDTQSFLIKKERVKRKISFDAVAGTSGILPIQNKSESSIHKLSHVASTSINISQSYKDHSPDVLLNCNEEGIQRKNEPSCLLAIDSHLHKARDRNLYEDLTKMADRDFLYCSHKNINNCISATIENKKCYASDTLFSSNCDNFYRLEPRQKAPTKNQVFHTSSEYGIPTTLNYPPFYSNPDDVSKGIEMGFHSLNVTSRFSIHQPEFMSTNSSMNMFRFGAGNMNSPHSNKLDTCNMNSKIISFCKNNRCWVTPAKKPPMKQDLADWFNKQSASSNVEKIKTSKVSVQYHHTPNEDDYNVDTSQSPLVPLHSDSYLEGSKCSGADDSSGKSKVSSNSSLRDEKSERNMTVSNVSITKTGEISGVTVNDTYGFEASVQNQQDVKALAAYSFLTIVIIELHISTRGEFRPDPNYDSVRAIFYSVFRDVPSEIGKNNIAKGIFATNSMFLNEGSNLPVLSGTGISCHVSYADSENHLVLQFAEFIQEWDPDIIAGYEIEMLSLAYLVDRSYVLGINLPSLLSRIQDDSQHKLGDKNTELKITGRIILDVWRLLRHEIAVQSYTLENMLYHILHRRVPRYSFKTLTYWWNHRSSALRSKCAKYYLLRVDGILQLLEKLDIIGRTCELAKLFGIQFYEVLSRGSQFRVESMMLRLAKPLNFIAVSPSVQQRAGMRAPEFLPLILEPESKLYTDPVIVLDFQSLYPSMMIAYNYCFSTCLGRVEHLGKSAPFEFGATQYRILKKKVAKLLAKDKLNFSPSGIAFVKTEVREGILPRMLREILDTRLMVKNSMKQNKCDRVLQKVLHNRQLGLKLIANVTYGYTAANYSGRMPSVEVADSVVSKGKETLQRAITLVDENQEWGARVVYGDTDSLFVLLPGKSKEEAFAVGEKIADAVTNSNPNPVKLKLEKVYYPCILQTKKRYVGYMYENKDQKLPTYDAKGIETVRRDGCPAVSKMLEKCLRLLFEKKDLSLIKQYVLKQFHKIISGHVSIQDLTFAKEYRGAANYKPGACVPALELARKWVATDKRSEPRRGERVPYVIINGPPGVPLIKLVRSPYDLLNDTSLRPNALYYVTQVIIPPINRCFNLFGVNVNDWFAQMPRINKQLLPNSSPGKKATISQYFVTSNCIVCSTKCQSTMCDLCTADVQTSSIILNNRVQHWENSFYTTKIICDNCTDSRGEVRCISLDCPVLYRLTKASLDLQQAVYVRDVLLSDAFGDVL